jgi:hypothetical protein
MHGIMARFRAGRSAVTCRCEELRWLALKTLTTTFERHQWLRQTGDYRRR